MTIGMLIPSTPNFKTMHIEFSVFVRIQHGLCLIAHHTDILAFLLFRRGETDESCFAQVQGHLPMYKQFLLFNLLNKVGMQPLDLSLRGSDKAASAPIFSLRVK